MNEALPIIESAAIPDDVAAVQALFLEYARSLDFSLCFQGFEQELASLPGEYAEPAGALLVARDDSSQLVGCVAVRRLTEDACEMKRLYVRPTARGSGLGRRLAEAAISLGRAKGYRVMRLDTVPSMVAAIRMYETLGFARIAPYRLNPIEGAVYMEIALRA